MGNDTTVLYHQTSQRAATTILKDGFSPGRAGSGIYFAESPDTTKHHVSGVTLECHVDLGKVKALPSPGDWGGNMRLMAGANGSIKATSLPTGIQYVVYDPKRVKKIVVFSGWASPNNTQDAAPLHRNIAWLSLLPIAFIASVGAIGFCFTLLCGILVLALLVAIFVVWLFLLAPFILAAAPLLVPVLFFLLLTSSGADVRQHD